jgi:hypothetical protein
MGLKTTRRWFLGGAVGGAAAFRCRADESGPDGLRLAVTTYSLRAYHRTLAVKMIQELKTPYISVKEFHMLYRSTAEEIAQARREFEAASLKIMSGGNITLQRNNEADMRKYFDYAKACGMPLIVCSPPART